MGTNVSVSEWPPGTVFSDTSRGSVAQERGATANQTANASYTRCGQESNVPHSILVLREQMRKNHMMPIRDPYSYDLYFEMYSLQMFD